MTEFPLSLSTTVEPAKKFLVDNIEYEMLGPDHLSPADEAEVLALFSRHNILTNELYRCRLVEKGKLIAKRQRAARIDVIAKLTTASKDIIETLPLSQQVKLLEALEELVVTSEPDEDEEETSEPDQEVGLDEDAET